MQRLLPAAAIAACLAYAAVAALVGPGALAEAPGAPAAGKIDLRQLLIDTVIPGVVVVVGAALTTLAARALRWLGVQDNKALGDVVDKALVRAVQYAGNVAVQKAMSAEWARPEIKSNALRAAVEYAVAQVPGPLKKLGYDPSTPEGRAAIERMIVARLDPADVPPPKAG